MKTILDEIVANKRLEVAQLKQEKSVHDFKNSPLFNRTSRSLKASISEVEFGIIAEIKRKSPSGGDIFPELSPVEQALYYQENGARAISVLTDHNYFGGSLFDLTQVSNNVELPVLRKEFIIDEIQLYEAKANGAGAVLLIAMILEKQEVIHLTDKAHELGLEVLFEVHHPEEKSRIYEKVDLIAVNNRNLALQHTDLEHSFQWIHQLPKNTPLISASGISAPEQIAQLHQTGYNGALIGESILRNKNLELLTIID